MKIAESLLALFFICRPSCAVFNGLQAFAGIINRVICTFDEDCIAYRQTEGLTDKKRKENS